MHTETTIKAVMPTATVIIERRYFGSVQMFITYESASGISDADQHLIDTAEMQMQLNELDAAFATLNTYYLAKRTDRQFDFGSVAATEQH